MLLYTQLSSYIKSSVHSILKLLTHVYVLSPHIFVLYTFIAKNNSNNNKSIISVQFSFKITWGFCLLPNKKITTQILIGYFDYTSILKI